LKTAVRLDELIVNGSLSYKEAGEIICKGCVRVNGKLLTAPWHPIRGGYYVIKIDGKPTQKVTVKKGRITKRKEVTP
jgi:ribosomal protein S4